MRYSIIALAAVLSSAVSASPMTAKRSGPRPYSSMSGRSFLAEKPTLKASPKHPFSGWKPNPSHKPMPISMVKECENHKDNHLYYRLECDDECRYEYDDCESCDDSLQPEYPTSECVVTEAPDTTTLAYSQKTVTVTVGPKEGCEDFLKNNPTCTYCEITVTSLTKATSYVTSATKKDEEICAAVTVTVTTTPCTPFATITPCAGCDEEYVTEQGQTVTSCVTSTGVSTIYCTETEASVCVYGAKTTTITHPTTVTYIATASCAATDLYYNVLGKQYPCPTTVYYQTTTYCTAGAYTFGGMTSQCPSSACSVAFPIYCPSATTFAWYSTVTSACESCPVATITAADCDITSCTTTYKATSTYCPTAGVYTCGTDTVTVPAATWVYYVEPCPTNYVCSYEDWCRDRKHFVVYEYIGIYLQEVYECDMEPWIHPVPTSQYFPEPTICVINDIEINITIAPTWYVWNSYVTETTTTTYPYPRGRGRPTSGASYPSGRPSASRVPSVGAPAGPGGSGPFSLSGLVNGVKVILIAADGILSTSTNLTAIGTIFEPISNGRLTDSDGDVFGIADLGEPITYSPGFTNRLPKRDLPLIWTQGADAPIASYNNQSLVYSACPSGDSSTINLDTAVMSGCFSFTPTTVDPGSSLSSLSGANSTEPNGGGHSAAPGIPPPAPFFPPYGPPSGGLNGTNYPVGAPHSPPGGPPSPGNGNSPQVAPPSLPIGTAAPSSNNTNSISNSTLVRRDFRRRFVY